MLKGIPASPGIAIGKAFLIQKKYLEIPRQTAENVAQEKERFFAAVETVKKQIEEIQAFASQKLGKDKALLFEAQLLILEDVELTDSVCVIIENKQVNAEYALKTTLDNLTGMFNQIDNPYLRERAVDVQDVGYRVLNTLMGIEELSLADIQDKCIIVAHDLTPSEVARINRDKVLGFVTCAGGRTSHSIIMARDFELPGVTGLKDAIEKIIDGDLLIIDGDQGAVIINPTEQELSKYLREQSVNVRSQEELLRLAQAESMTRDGKKIQVSASIGNPGDIPAVQKNGAEGIGLFRTEFLYLNKKGLPTEEELFESYKTVLIHIGDKPVVIRTLDIGGDKKLNGVSMEKELNPSLGYRALRLCLDRKDIFKTQLRAILKASVYGNLKIMFPMISCLQELREAKEVMEEVKEELAAEDIRFKKEIPVGIMVEIPSAAIISDIFAKEVDFFSIGTNDLMQYTLAVDRMNERLSYLYDPFNPAVLRLIKLVIENAHQERKWVGMCGEMAGDIRFIPILIGLGLDEFSMNSSNILKAKKIIGNLEFDSSRTLAADILKMATSDEIRDYMESKFNFI